MAKKKKHGGARKGAGAPPLPPGEKARNRSIKVTDQDWEKLDSISKRENLSKTAWIVAQIRSKTNEP